MQVNITARHLDLTPALKGYSEKKLLKAKKYAKNITNAHIILNVEKDRHIAEIVLHISGQDISAKSVAGDMYGAVDLVMDKILKQLRRHMDKLKKHKDSLPYPEAAEMSALISSSPKEGKSLLEEVREVNVLTQEIPQALKKLRDRDLNFWAFRESSTGDLSIAYRKEDGSYGMMIIR